MQRVALCVGIGATAGHAGYECHGIDAALGIRVGRIAFGRSGAVAKIPYKRGAAPCVAEGHAIGGATRCGRHKFGHGEVVGDIEAEQCIVAVRRAVAVAPGHGGGGETLCATTRAANRLIERCQAVETRRAAVHMVGPVVAAARRIVQLAKEGGIFQRVGIGVDAHDVEILSVGRVAPGVGGGLHAPGPGAVPLHIGVAHKIAPPARKVDAVADVGCKSRGREVDAARSAEKGAPHPVAQVGQHTHQQHAAIIYAVARVVDKVAAAHGLRLPEEEHLVATSRADKIELVIETFTHKR